MGNSIVAFVLGVWFGAVAVIIAFNINFTCTQQRAIRDTMPQEFECTQWTKGE